MPNQADLAFIKNVVAVLAHRANDAVHRGHRDLVLSLPAYCDGATGLQSAVADGESLFSDEPLDEDTLELNQP